MKPPDSEASAADAPPPTGATLPPQLRQRVLSQVAQHPSPTRRALARQAALVTTASWLVAAVIFFLAGAVRITGRPVSLVLGSAVGTSLVVGVVVWAALGRGGSTVGRARQSLLPIVIGSPLAILAWKLFWGAQYSGALDQWPTRPGFRCLGLSLSIGLCPIIAFMIARRNSDPVRPGLTGFAAGIAIGCITALLTDLWCPVAYLPHLLLGHLLPIAALGALGAWLGRQFVAMQSKSSAAPPEHHSGSGWKVSAANPKSVK